MDFKTPFISHKELAHQAAAFLAKYHTAGGLPIPIERIAVFHLGLDIIPTLDLQRNFEIDAYVTNDRVEVWVDKYVLESRTNRYRFSLAHEIGHLMLHPGLFELHFDNVAEWKTVVNSIPGKEYSFLEWQASYFAGLVLVPPAELARVFDMWRGKLAGIGLNLEEQDDRVWDILESHIGKEFVVSADVIHRRLEFDGHLEIIAGNRVRPKR